MSILHFARLALPFLLLSACLCRGQIQTRTSQPPAPRPPVYTPPPQSRISAPSRPVQQPGPARSAPQRPITASETSRPAPPRTDRTSSTAKSSANRGIPSYSSHTTASGRNNAPNSQADIPPEQVLSGKSADLVLNRVNARRSLLGGLNARQLPKGKITPHSGGGFTLKSKNGAQYEIRSNGSISSFRSSELSAHFFGNGRIATVHTASLDIRRGSHGERTVVSRRPDGSTLVSTGPHAGYLEKTISTGGHTQLIQRTYVTNEFVRSRFYASYSYYGVALQRYLSLGPFAPAFYGWAYFPWATPVVFTWGWADAPWFSYYRDYFVPYGVYQSGYAWLSDYYLSNLLAGSFSGSDSAGKDEIADSGRVYAQTDTPISPELKNEIAGEVQQELALINSSTTGDGDLSQTELPAAIRRDHIFVVSASLDLITENQETCSLSAGDILQLAAPPHDGVPLAQAKVASSKRADCPAGAIVSISLENLQEMQNDLRASIDYGLADLRDHQGLDGWPQAPASALLAPPRPALDSLPGADPAASGLIAAQQQQATETETNLMAAAGAKK